MKGFFLLPASMKFEQYHLLPEIKENLDKLGFKRPTDIQFKAIPPIMNGEDVLAIAHAPALGLGMNRFRPLARGTRQPRHGVDQVQRAQISGAQ